MDALAVEKSDDVLALVCGHIEKIRSHQQLRDALIVFVCEANLDYVMTDWVSNVVQQECFQPVHCPSFDPKGNGRYGIWTTEQNKNKYVESLRTRLMNNNIHVGEKPFTCTPGKTFENLKAEAIEELGRYQKVWKENKDDVWGKQDYRWSGKRGGNDDMAIGIQICSRVIDMLNMNVGWRREVSDLGFKP